MTNTAHHIIDGQKVELIGNAGNSHIAYYSNDLNQLYLSNKATDEVKTLSHEEYIEICGMRREIEALARENAAPIKVIGIAADVERVLFSSEYNMVYLTDTVMETTTRLPLDTYFSLCKMRRSVESLAILQAS